MIGSQDHQRILGDRARFKCGENFADPFVKILDRALKVGEVIANVFRLLQPRRNKHTLFAIRAIGKRTVYFEKAHLSKEGTLFCRDLLNQLSGCKHGLGRAEVSRQEMIISKPLCILVNMVESDQIGLVIELSK